MKKPPTLNPLKILGNALNGSAGRADLALKAAIAHGNVVRLPVPGKRVYLVTGPEEVRRILVQNHDNYRKSFDYQILARLLGQGLVTSGGDKWKKDRKNVQPLFQGGQNQAFLKHIIKCTDQMLSDWQRKCDAGTGTILFDKEMMRLGLHIIGERILSLDVRPYSDEIAAHLDICQHHIVRRGMALFDFAKVFTTPAESKFNRSLKRLYEIIDGLIETRKNLDFKNQQDLYSILSRSGNSHDEIRDQVLTLFMAGHETSALALTWTFYLLSKDRETASKMQLEADAILKSESESEFVSPSYDSISRLTYTRQVLEESMRIYPPIAFLGRESVRQDVLGGFNIPADSVIILCPYATQLRPDIWNDPLRFDPDRFSETEKEKHAIGSYFPFSMGPRGCIGYHFAMMELLTVTSMISSHFELHWDGIKEPNAIPLISLRPDRHVPMRLIRRRHLEHSLGLVNHSIKTAIQYAYPQNEVGIR